MSDSKGSTGLLDIKLHKPQSIEEAVKLLGDLEDAKLVAGGTDLLVDIKQGLITAKNLISLQNIQSLRGIWEETGKIWIGAMMTPKEIQTDSLINQHVPSLSDAARSIAATQIRSMATIGGNVASAVPSADMPPPLIAAEASGVLDCGTSREISLAEFFTGARETICGAAEVLASVWIPIPPPRTGSSYQKLALREANALAVVGVASQISLSGDKIAKANIVLGAVAPTPILALKASESLRGQRPSESLFEEAAYLAKQAAKPISDIRASAWYRKELIPILTRRSLDVAWVRVREQS
ncbi:MAG: xanthine dehydrogenase family protein subunit M [Candidatus Aminicenantes bacterium]|nr:MAG: xanthine dehydrogenase family protein subunit M [Candidatus Aminicenantes bacterium]